MPDKLKQHCPDYMVKNIFVMKYSPKIRHLEIKKRKISSFLYVICGKYHYVSDFIDFYAESGDLIYLPLHSKYDYTVLSENTECIQVEFELEELKNGIVSHKTFSEHPAVIKGRGNTLTYIFNDLLNSYYNDEFLTIATLCKLISFFKKIYYDIKNTDRSFCKIEPAIKYIEQNFCNKIHISELAKICDISQSHLRRLFNQHLGMTPIKYKNSIFMRTAANMLCKEGFNVSETAEALNFSDIYTFSQLFKKEFGLSPKKYMEIYKKEI